MAISSMFDDDSNVGIGDTDVEVDKALDVDVEIVEAGD
jgi:hypothetical protein